MTENTSLVYVCSICKKPCTFDSDNLTVKRDCEHSDAPIIAQISAKCKGSGGFK